MEIMQQDIMNNCLVKGTMSGAMGGVAGFAFGIFTASLENAGAGVSDCCFPRCSAWPPRQLRVRRGRHARMITR